MSASSGQGAPILTPASAHPVLDPLVQQAVDQVLDLELPPMRQRDLEAVRRWAKAAQAPLGPLPDADIADLDLVIAAGSSVAVRILRPAGVHGPLPIILYLHGGGWIMGDRHTHDRIMRELAHGARAAVVFVDYALAPRARHPVQNDQAYGALVAVVARAGELGLDGGRVAVAGDCAGGGMAAAVTFMARSRQGPDVKAQALFYPITAPVSSNASYVAFGDGPGPSADDLRFFQQSLLGDHGDPAGAFCLETPLQRLRGLPPTLVITAEADVVRDEGEAYARKLMRAGVCVTAVRFNGTVHDFMVLEALKETAGAKAALLLAKDFLHQALWRDADGR